MATNSYENTPGRMDTAMPEEGGMGEGVPCLHIYKMADGSYAVKQDEAPPPEDAQPVGSTQEVLAMVEDMGLTPAQDGEGMEAAKRGYDKFAKREPMAAPGGIFGE